MKRQTQVGAASRTYALVCGLLIAACSGGEVPCPCGQQYSVDPFDPGGGPLSIGAEHRQSDHCLCYCNGADDEVLMPPSRNCLAYEGQSCVSADESSGQLVCP